VSRGYSITGRSIARVIGLEDAARKVAFDPSSEILWTWLSLALSEAGLRLEDYLPTTCDELERCQDIADQLSILLFPGPGYIAKLNTCERIARMSTVFDALTAMSAAIDETCDDLFSDAQEEISMALNTAQGRFEEIQDRSGGLYGEFWSDLADHRNRTRWLCLLRRSDHLATFP
jgi:hypothetical protein